MTLTIDPHGEELIEAQLRTGRFRSREEVVTRALEALASQGPVMSEDKRTIAEVVEHMLEARKGTTLGGLKIKDLVNEGRKY